MVSWGHDFDPFEIKTKTCKELFERERSKFTDDEIRQMKEIAERYIAQFGITVEEAGFGR